MLLNRVSDRWVETVGTAVGCTAWFFIGSQVLSEWSSPAASSLSLTYLYGFLLQFAFWCLYGFRFRRIAIWLPNFIAFLLQIALLLVVSLK